MNEGLQPDVFGQDDGLVGHMSEEQFWGAKVQFERNWPKFCRKHGLDTSGTPLRERIAAAAREGERAKRARKK